VPNNAGEEERGEEERRRRRRREEEEGGGEAAAWQKALPRVELGCFFASGEDLPPAAPAAGCS
jgi:hypothetical protein